MKKWNYYIVRQHIESLKKLLKPYFFALMCLVTYGGAVNLGGFGFFPAIPAFVFMVYMAVKSGKAYRVGAIITMLISVPLYFLKHEKTWVFQPLLGEEIQLTQAACYKKIRYSYLDGEVSEFVLISSKDEYECDSMGLASAVGSGEWPAGTSFTIKAIDVSHADFSETYRLVFDTDEGEVKVSIGYRHGLLEMANGQAIEASDLRRGIFYYPSLLMYWLIFPIMLPNLFFTL